MFFHLTQQISSRAYKSTHLYLFYTLDLHNIQYMSHLFCLESLAPRPNPPLPLVNLVTPELAKLLIISMSLRPTLKGSLLLYLDHLWRLRNTNSNQHNIPMLAGGHKDKLEVVPHCFCYGCIISIYHANMQYIGLGLKDYNTHWLDFLHIWWFELIPPNVHGGVGLDLDLLQFVLMNTKNAFSFIDPNVLRGCHLIPTFTKGQSQPDGEHYIFTISLMLTPF